MNKRGGVVADVIQDKLILNDNEYMILAEISTNDSTNQRKLSKKLGVSLGTVNALLAKMTREGIIKVEQVSGRQVAYMLTPKGMLEKAKKTVSYLKSHYRAIYQSKEKIKVLIDELAKTYGHVIVLRNKDEFGAIVDIATAEYNAKLVAIELESVYKLSELKLAQSKEKCALLNATADMITAHDLPQSCTVINMLEKL